MTKYVVAVVVALFSNMAHAAGCDTEAASRVWAKCSACHSAEPGVAGMLGPNLYGLMGRKAGKLDGYSYSPAMQKADFTWTPDMLKVFIKSPQEAVPGTRMPFSGLKEPKDREAIACYLSPRHP